MSASLRYLDTAFFWVVTAWPNGASAVVFAATVILLLSPRGDLAYGGAIAFAVGVAVGVPCAAIIKFAVLPGLATFPAFCGAIGLFLVPAGFALAMSRRPALVAVFSCMAFNFMPLLAPTNEMSYDIEQFYNTALSIVVGCSVAPLAFLLLPPLSSRLRSLRFTRRVSLLRRAAASGPSPPNRLSRAHDRDLHHGRGLCGHQGDAAGWR